MNGPRESPKYITWGNMAIIMQCSPGTLVVGLRVDDDTSEIWKLWNKV